MFNTLINRNICNLQRGLRFIGLKLWLERLKEVDNLLKYVYRLSQNIRTRRFQIRHPLIGPEWVLDQFLRLIVGWSPDNLVLNIKLFEESTQFTYNFKLFVGRSDYQEFKVRKGIVKVLEKILLYDQKLTPRKVNQLNKVGLYIYL